MEHSLRAVFGKFLPGLTPGVLIGWFAIGYRPLLALYYQQRAGEVLAQAILSSRNDRGGFSCLQSIEELEARKRLETILSDLRIAESLAPSQSHTYYISGKILCLLGDYESAIRAFQRFAELRPRNPIGFLEMGFALLQACPPNGKCPNGLNTYDVWRNGGVRAEDFLALAERARQREDYRQALQWYRHAQRMGAEVRGTIALMAYYVGGEENQNLRRNLDRATQIDHGWVNERDRIQATYLLGITMFQEKDYEAARNYFHRTIRLAQNREDSVAEVSMSYLYIGLSYAYTGNLSEALPYLKKSIEVGPRNEWAHVNYSIHLYYIDPSKTEEVKQHFELALQLRGEDVRIWEAIIGFWKNTNVEEGLAYCSRSKEAKIAINPEICQAP